MDLQSIISFAVIAALLVMSPGPNGLLIAKSVATRSTGAGFANIAGFIAAFCVQGALSVLGVAALLVQSAELFTVFKVLGAFYLIYLGFKSLRGAFANTGAITSPKTHASKPYPRYRGAFWEGFLTNALNPKTAMFYLAAFPQFIPQGSGAWSSAALLVAIHCVLNAVWFAGMIGVFQRVGKHVVKPMLARLLKGATGALFIAFGVKLATMRVS
ncbi:MAG: LysE family translocator [Pseudomonadota bacterium]